MIKGGFVGKFLALTVVWGFVVAYGCLAPATNAYASWELQWAKMVQAAKEEGRITVITSSPRFAEPFQKRYPEIKFVNVNLDPPQIAYRVMAERRAGKYLVDLVITGANPNYQVFYPNKIVDPIRPALILPEVIDQSKWWGGKHTYIDEDNQYVFVHMGGTSRGSPVITPSW